MNPLHKKLIKRLALGDKEAEGLLTQLYYDTPEEGRPALLVDMTEKSGECAVRLKDVLLEQQDIEDAARAKIKEEVEKYIEEHGREVICGEGSGGDDETNGGGRGAGGA